MTTTVLNTKNSKIEKKISDINDFVKKTVYDTKISDIRKKYFTISDYNKFMSNILYAKITQKEQVQIRKRALEGNN